ncbi:hypothetical protein CDAR_96591 [Caerostris darwini]|uniref:Uncharacterized protein n=1 Tax=Caerostris darwini TaxID=1538125 RepID=A0AAV4QY96_9ARAC|nr:hypothetical protein CDAR_96591 [Caerostris darwini]
MESLNSSILERGRSKGTIRPNEKCFGSLGKSRIPLATFPDTGEGAKGRVVVFLRPLCLVFRQVITGMITWRRALPRVLIEVSLMNPVCRRDS